MSLSGDLAPLQEILDKILSRVEAIEKKVGVAEMGNTQSEGSDGVEGKCI